MTDRSARYDPFRAPESSGRPARFVAFGLAALAVHAIVGSGAWFASSLRDAAPEDDDVLIFVDVPDPEPEPEPEVAPEIGRAHV